MVAALDAGADDFVTKPFQQVELLARLRSSFRTREVIRRMEQAHDIVVALANAVEAKDLGLKDHCRYLAYRSARLAAYVGLRDGELEGVAYGALLHDIGKIGISEHVLHKPGPLTEDEFRIMREHPEIGERICDPLRMSRDFTPIIRHHHERWDGSRLSRRPQGRADPAGRAHRGPRRCLRRHRPRSALPCRAHRRGGLRRAAASTPASSSTRVSCRSSSRRPTGSTRASRPAWSCRGWRCWAATRPSSPARRAARDQSLRLTRGSERAGQMTAQQVPPGPLRYHLVRLVLKVVVSAYVRTSVVGAERLPAAGPYIICFNHPSWLDPIVFAATWPDRERRLYIFGPREQDMSTGIRNHLINWTRRGVPFKPPAQDVVDVTRRAVAVLRTGACLAIAGEGRLSDHEGRILPLETGLAHFAQHGLGAHRARRHRRLALDPLRQPRDHPHRRAGPSR